MRGFRGASRVDLNQASVVAALQAEGASVLDCSSLGCGFPDLLVGYGGRNFLMEVKNPANSYGRKGLNARQTKWHEKWHGLKPVVVWSADQAVAYLRQMDAQYAVVESAEQAIAVVTA